VKVDEKKTIGMFAYRTFPPNTGIGFYVVHPWFKWVQPFTVTPPEQYDAYLQLKHYIPEKEADAYMWFYDDEDYMTCCDPLRKKCSDKKGIPQKVVPCKRILGMGFHLVKTKVDDLNIVVDNNGCIKTTKEVKAGTELVF
jgi:hypothetical protein